jgi:hypothetical protein
LILSGESILTWLVKSPLHTNIIRRYDLNSYKILETDNLNAIYITRISENPESYDQIETIVTKKLIDTSNDEIEIFENPLNLNNKNFHGI